MTLRYTEYDSWAWLYNDTLGPVYAAEKLEVLRRVLLPAVPANACLLDLCCGTGQLAQLLVDEGFNVTGVDGSEIMLEYARMNAPSAEFMLADARSFEVEKEFHGACCTSAALNHVESVGDLRRVFSQVARVLKKGAVFVFDVNHPASMRANWCGNPLVGGIEEHHSWLATTYYDAASSRGAFMIDIFRDPDHRSSYQPVRSVASPTWELTHDKTRLETLRSFQTLKPSWEHTRLTYSIYGHELDVIASTLKECGFTNVTVQTAGGGAEVTENDPAYFVCVK